MATDSQIVASLNTLTGDTGEWQLQGYDPISDQLVFTSEDEFNLYFVDRDGSNPRTVYSGQGGTGGTNMARGMVYEGFLYVCAGYTWSKIDLISGGGAVVDVEGTSSRDAIKTEYDPVGNRMFASFDTDNIEVLTLSDGDANIWDFGSAVQEFTGLYDVENSDASTGGIWLIQERTPSGGNEVLKYYSIDNHDQGTAGDNLHSLDLVGAGSPIGGVDTVIDMAYDSGNGVVYMMIDEDGAGTIKIYAFTHSESVTPGDISLVGAVSADAVLEFGRFVLFFDSYEEQPAAITDTSPMIWLDAADAEDSGGATPTEGEAVDAWPDKSGNGNDVLSVSGCVYDVDHADLNNLPAVYFDGVDDYIRLPDGTFENGCTFILVFRLENSDSGRLIALGEPGGGNQPIAIGLDGAEDLNFYYSSQIDLGINVDDTAAEIVAFQDRTLAEFQAYVHSELDGYNLLVSAFPPPPITADMDSPQLIGAGPDTFPTIEAPIEMSLAALLGWNRILPPSELKTVIDLLRTTYIP